MFEQQCLSFSYWSDVTVLTVNFSNHIIYRHCKIYHRRRRRLMWPHTSDGCYGVLNNVINCWLIHCIFSLSLVVFIELKVIVVHLNKCNVSPKVLIMKISAQWSGCFYSNRLQFFHTNKINKNNKILTENKTSQQLNVHKATTL